jgi:transposase InsO family protein
VTIVGYLRRRHPKKPWPAFSTAGEILKRHGLVKPRRKRRRLRHPGRPYLPMEAPNDTWAADFKGEFKTRDGRLCYPLTITDGHSRFLLACRGRLATGYELARPVFEETFRTYGLPHQILTDGGSPFGSTGLAGLSRLAVWWVKLGIQPVRIQPSHPEQNGRHERMHRTLAPITRPPAGNLAAQQRRFSRFVTEYNEVRPHRALDLHTPSERYTPSPRPYPGRTPQITYPGHFEVRKADVGGRISWHDRPLRTNKVLRGELIGLEPIEEGLYHVYFGPLLLGVFDQDLWQING